MNAKEREKRIKYLQDTIVLQQFLMEELNRLRAENGIELCRLELEDLQSDVLIVGP